MVDTITSRVDKVRKFEQKYVHNIYDQSAISSNTFETSDEATNRRAQYRKCWNKVTEFIGSFPRTALIGDIGFGDGKFLDVHQGVTVGLEKSWPLCEEASKRTQRDTMAADMTRIPFRTNIFDGLICVAVIHHLASKNRRVAAFRELSRVLTPGGKILLTVWAIGAKHKEFGGCDVLVPFKKKEKTNECIADLRENTKTTALGYFHSEFTQLKERLSANLFINTIQTKLTSAKPIKKLFSDQILRPSECDEEICTAVSENEGKSTLKPDIYQDNLLRPNIEKDSGEENYKYYHIFTRIELTELICSIKTLRVLESYYDKGSWVFVLVKI